MTADGQRSVVMGAGRASARLRMRAAELRAALPRGALMPDDVWEARHRGIVLLLWAHAPALFLFALYEHDGLLTAAWNAATVCIFAFACSLPRVPRRQRAIAASVGLVSCSALLVHLWHGVTEAHFHFFVVVSVLTLYQDWVVFGVAILYVLLHHGLVGVLDPGAVYGTNPAAVADPWQWAFIHGGFVLAASAASVVAWKANEQLLDRVRHDAQMRVLSDSHLVGIIHGYADRIQDANDVFLRMTGYTREEVDRGALDRDRVIPAEYHERMSEWRSEAVGGSSRPFELEFRCADGSRIPVILGATVLSAEPYTWMAFVLDRSDYQAAERARRHLLGLMLDAEQAERTRIAHDLHDDSIQVMTAAIYRLDGALMRIESGGAGSEVRDALVAARHTLASALDRTRTLTFELHPPLLRERGLAAAVRKLAERIERDTGARVSVVAEGDARPSQQVEELAYRTITEALSNVRRHAQAHNVEIGIDVRPDAVHCRVGDDGVGFDPHNSAQLAGHLGLVSMRERVELAGGSMRVASAPGSGTRIEFGLPETAAATAPARIA